MRNHQERTLILRIAATCAIAMALIAVIPTFIGFTLYKNIVNDRINDNAEVGQALARFAFQQCVQAELRDVVYAQWGGALLTLAREIDPSDANVRHLITVLEDGIETLEPPDESDCIPPLERGQP